MRQLQRVGTVLILLVAGFASLKSSAQEKAAQNLAPIPQAQPWQAGGFGFDGGTGLLMLDQIQEELGLSAEQVDKIRKIQSEVGEQMRGLYDGLGELKAEERPARFKAIQEKMQEIGKASHAKIAEVLKPEQSERLKQINLQLQMRRGGSLISAEVVAAALELPDAERDMLREREQKVAEELRETIARAQLEARGKLLESLTPEQRAKLEEMQGKPFEFKWVQRGAGGQPAPAGSGTDEEKK
jgi:Spy/CpxP family protein refolding chaperone